MEQYPLLDSIRTIEDFRKMPKEQLPALAEELRGYIVETVSQTGGHLASSLGAVEIIIAMHRVFDGPNDRMIFDVGHQSYAHKILTGRKEAFRNLRQKDGISGFPKREESPYDAFNTGHASTSVSAALGYARAYRTKMTDGSVVALIGDGAMTGGLAMEAMNDAGQAGVPLIVILNDNDMSISPNVGAMHRTLINMRTSKGYVGLKRAVVRTMDTGTVGRFLTKHMENFKNRVKNFLMPNMPFEEMGFMYLGPVDGHSIREMTRILKRAKQMDGAVLIHAVTKKGKGYGPAEENPELFHGIGPFDIKTGLPKGGGKKTNSDVFGETVCELAKSDPDLVAVTAAMPLGTGLKPFAKAYPDRFYDVGIAEEHAMTMAAGMAAGGLHPVVAVYSSFLQRAYDEILHDIALMKLPVVIGVDRAGLVGNDGETHQGQYDAAILTSFPNMNVYSPSTLEELREMIKIAVFRREPAAVRYSRGTLPDRPLTVPVAFGKWELLRPVRPVTVIASGTMVETALQAAEETDIGVVNARFFMPLDEEMLFRLKDCRLLVTMEDSVDTLGALVAKALPDVRVRRLCIPNSPIKQASVAEQRTATGLTKENLIGIITEEV